MEHGMKGNIFWNIETELRMEQKWEKADLLALVCDV